MFEEHEELLGLFAKLKELRTKEEQAESVELQEHATKVMSTLDEGIKELDDLDTFFSFLTQIGQSHRKIPGFKPDYFWVSSFFFNFYFNFLTVSIEFESEISFTLYYGDMVFIG